jgi:hypothetical protein
VNILVVASEITSVGRYGPNSIQFAAFPDKK